MAISKAITTTSNTSSNALKDSAANERACSLPSRSSLSANNGTKARLNAPSANSRLKRFGNLKATKNTLKAANTSAREELKLAKAAAKAEITVLKDQLNSVIKREKALLKIAEQKTVMMVKAAEQWEKKQVSKIQKMFKKAPKA